MAGLIIDLQRDCLNASIDTSNLLRKALVVSKKLKLPETEAWIGHELSGYYGHAAVPDYRQLRGTFKAKNPYTGWIPVDFPDVRWTEAVSTLPATAPIHELEDLVRNRSGNGLFMNYSPEVEAKLVPTLPMRVPIALHISASAVAAIFDAVRTRILEWALELEAQGVVGENFSFSEPEIMAAHNNTYITNNIGTMQNSMLQQASSSSTQVLNTLLPVSQLTEFVDAIRANLNSLGLSQDLLEELKSDVDSIRSQLTSPKPKPGIVRGLLGSVKSVLEQASSSVIASGLATQVTALLPLIVG